MMVLTLLEANVEPENWKTLEAEYTSATQHLDAGIVRTVLLQSKRETNSWQILTVWESQEILNAMRQSGETPRGVLIFRAAKAEPSLAIFDVVAQAIA